MSDLPPPPPHASPLPPPAAPVAAKSGSARRVAVAIGLSVAVVALAFAALDHSGSADQARAAPVSQFVFTPVTGPASIPDEPTSLVTAVERPSAPATTPAPAPLPSPLVALREAANQLSALRSVTLGQRYSTTGELAVFNGETIESHIDLVNRQAVTVAQLPKHDAAGEPINGTVRSSAEIRLVGRHLYLRSPLLTDTAQARRQGFDASTYVDVDLTSYQGELATAMSSLATVDILVGLLHSAVNPHWKPGGSKTVQASLSTSAGGEVEIAGPTTLEVRLGSRGDVQSLSVTIPLRRASMTVVWTTSHPNEPVVVGAPDGAHVKDGQALGQLLEDCLQSFIGRVEGRSASNPSPSSACLEAH